MPSSIIYISVSILQKHPEDFTMDWGSIFYPSVKQSCTEDVYYFSSSLYFLSMFILPLAYTTTYLSSNFV